MSLKDIFKARKAYKAHRDGNYGEAMKLYGECYDAGMQDANAMLAYSVLLLRDKQYQKGREVLVTIQKYPMKPDQKAQLYVNYAAAVYRLGDLDKAIDVLEKQHAKGESGMIYEALGYLYVEAGDADKALEYNLKALAYDDEDAVTLDNLGQTYYRLKQNKEKAKEYFDKAIEIKPSQMDTRYFLALYDIDAGELDKAEEALTALLDARFSPLNYSDNEKVQAQLDRIAALRQG